ncbi:MAG TPA: asparaginase [Acidimicrobiia bacterium]
MLAAKTRSGLVETLHDGAAAVVSADGDLVAWSGDVDRPFYLRSAAKPFQAAAAQDAGAQLEMLELAAASSSHDGHPVHVAIVESMLQIAGLGESDLLCPPDWPLSPDAGRRLAREGHASPRRIWHNCSGKHAAWLRASTAQGWPSDSYLEPDHPIQRRIVELVSDLGQYRAEPVGIDGCGAPVLRTTTRAMALLFARLSSQSELGAVFTAMHRYPALISGTGHGDASIATAINAAAKRGAEGCIGVGVENRFGVAVKSWDGLQVAADVGAVAVLSAMGHSSQYVTEQLAVVGRPSIEGGATKVGEIEPRLELQWT